LVIHLKRKFPDATILHKGRTCGSVDFYMSMTYAFSPPAQTNSNACYTNAKRGAKKRECRSMPRSPR
jgi:hypothetical protein